MDPLVFMKVAGILVILKPLFGAYVVMIWLICIALVLIIGGNYFDVAVRDLVMAIDAFSFAQITLITKKTHYVLTILKLPIACPLYYPDLLK